MKYIVAFLYGLVLVTLALLPIWAFLAVVNGILSQLGLV